ncbi:MAG: InlB B-repeat-containing protein [Coriobacteriia bacterium]|nr:InlB B-repeat-containing protein [Coriobacteriia bacterium]
MLRKKFISFVLAPFVALAFMAALLALPGGAAFAAATVVNQSDVDAAGGCYTLRTGDYELGQDIEGGFYVLGSVSLDLKGHTVSNSANQGVFSLATSKSLTVSNGTVVQNHTNNAAFRTENNSSLTISDVVATSHDHVCIDNEGGTTVIKGGTYTVNNSEKSASVLRAGRYSGTSGVTIKGGTFSAVGKTPSNLIDTVWGAKVSINGASCFSSFPSKAQLGDGFYMLKTDKGFEAVAESSLADVLWEVSDISDSSIGSAYFLSTADKDAFLESYKGTAKPYNGYTVTVSTNLEGVSAGIPVARGEKFSSFDLYTGLGLGKKYFLESLVDAEGNTFDFDTVINSNIELTATFKQVVAYIGDTGYESLQAAIAAVSNNQTVELCDDVTADLTIENGKTFTLDLGGKTLTAASNDAAALEVSKNSKLTVKNGSIKASSNAVYLHGDMGSSLDSNSLTLDGVTASSSAAAAVRAEYGTLNVKSGTYTATSASAKDSEGLALYLAGVAATIDGGSFVGADETPIAVGVYGSGSLTVNGGEFTDQIDPGKGSLTVNGGTFGSCANLGSVAEGKNMLKHKGAGYEVLDTSAAMASASCVVTLSGGQALYFESVDEAKAYADAQAGSKVTKVCHVSFEDTGDTEIATQDILYGGIASVPDSAPTKEGYTFAGWQLDGAEYPFDTAVTEDITLKASWNINTYTVTFLNEDGSTLSAQEVKYNEKASAPDQAPTKDGWAFAGWTLDGQTYDFSAPVKGNIELKPSWNQIFIVSFVDENGDKLAEPQQVENGKCASDPDPAPTKEGYTLKGWKNGQDEFSLDTPITGDTTLTANWTINTYTVTFKTNGGSSVGSQKIDYGSYASAPDPAPTKDGYEFVSWQYDGKDFDFQNIPITADITLEATWTEKEYTVTFDTDGGSAAPESQKVKYDEYATQPEAPTKDGKGFVGWFEVDEDGNISDDDEDYFDFEEGTITEDITLRAKWGNVVAENNGRLFASFYTAVENAQSGSTVKLLADDKSNSAGAEVFNKDLTIDLGGKSLAGENISGIFVIGKSNVLVKNGEIKAPSLPAVIAAGYEGSAKVNLQDVNIAYTGDGSSGFNGPAAVTAYGDSEIVIDGGNISPGTGTALLCYGGKIKVNSGEFSGNYESHNYAAGVASGTLEINGGTFNDCVVVRDSDASDDETSSLAAAAESSGSSLAELVADGGSSDDDSDSEDQDAKLIINGGKFGTADNYASLASGKVFFKHAASGTAKAYYEVEDEAVALKSHCWKASGSTGTIYFESKDEAVAYAGDESQVEENVPAPTPDPTPVATDISAAKVTLSKTAFTYNGKAQKPSVKSVVLNGKTLKAGTDYTASIASGKKVGTYSVTVTAKGSYTGKATASFVINPKGVTKFKVSKAKKSFKAKWAKSKTERSGVQLKYSTKKSMANAKTVKAKGASAKAKTVKKLKKKTKYYVQARAYKVVNGKTYYSAWSAKKAVKTK